MAHNSGGCLSVYARNLIFCHIPIGSNPITHRPHIQIQMPFSYRTSPLKMSQNWITSWLGEWGVPFGRGGLQLGFTTTRGVVGLQRRCGEEASQVTVLQCVTGGSCPSVGVAAYRGWAGLQLLPWFKVAVSVTDLEGPEVYRSRCIGLVLGDTLNKLIRKFKKI